MNNQISLYWFKQDLRLSDNPGLLEASKLGKVLPIYINDETCPKESEMGSASKVWLHHSLQSLQESLTNHLNLYQGNPEKIIHQLVHQYDTKNIFWSAIHEPWHIRQEHKLKKMLLKLGVNLKIYDASYLWHPKDILKNDGAYYKVFTAYKRKARLLLPRTPLPEPENLVLVKDKSNKTTIKQFKLIPKQSWHKKIMAQWKIGEHAAQQKLSAFIQDNLSGYQKGRNYPSQKHTSRFSPHLHFGEVSPYQIWNGIHSTYLFQATQDIEHFLNEMTWREFSNYLMYHFKYLHKDNFHIKFNSFPWQHNDALLKAWQTGNTGYPIVDAGMRELWQTGYMHNRVRMVVASFLVKNLMIHWHHGRDWFWDCLVDADLANNSAGWQWVAGCGVDAAPYFRIFNPILQGEKFDRDGLYTKKFIPELKNLPNKYLFKPWMAPKSILKTAGIVLGKTYPNPVIDLTQSRVNALEAYKTLSNHCT